jgi:hypothetical protein
VAERNCAALPKKVMPAYASSVAGCGMSHVAANEIKGISNSSYYLVIDYSMQALTSRPVGFYSSKEK